MWNPILSFHRCAAIFFLLHIPLILHSDRDQEVAFEPCSQLEDLNLEVGRNSADKEEENLGESSRRYYNQVYKQRINTGVISVSFALIYMCKP